MRTKPVRAKTYAQLALDQIPRVLGNLDRNPLSPTYGCFHRGYWLDKTSDFADAVRQFSTHALALVYTHQFPGNIYYQQQKIKDWAVAAMLFWSKIQHQDGSFDEFYPFERGWVGPTAFTTFTTVESFSLLKDKIDNQTQQKILTAIKKSAYFIAQGELEADYLANHHAMACLSLWKASELLKDKSLKTAYHQAWKTFLTYQNEEGWSREYDGVDPGYLSATVSFLAKIYQDNQDPEIFQAIKDSVKFSSYFVYPNGFYAGSLGSRNTLHFYPHGYEIIAKKIPLAAAIADKLLKSLKENKLVPPTIISDRYVGYRIPEFLQAYLAAKKRKKALPKLPYEQKSLSRYFDQAKIWVKKQGNYYLIANLAKGGVIKVFNIKKQKLIFNDTGIMAQLTNDKLITSQWIDPDYQIDVHKNKWRVTGQLQYVPSHKLFTPLKLVIFRLVLLLIGWQPKLAHLLKGQIRKMLILGQRQSPINFYR
ncbi:MAG: hypothetical protein GF390_03385, partial [Candidatus Pacebacteria bacterium]|nr:hypothetical protein [Candidatus Paceibacterota bacterium]